MIGFPTVLPSGYFTWLRKIAHASMICDDLSVQSGVPTAMIYKQKVTVIRVPSGKRVHSYLKKNRNDPWVNQLFLRPFSIVGVS